MRKLESFYKLALFFSRRPTHASLYFRGEPAWPYRHKGTRYVSFASMRDYMEALFWHTAAENSHSSSWRHN